MNQIKIMGVVVAIIVLLFAWAYFFTGNQNEKVKIDYFYSEACSVCIQEAPIIEEFTNEFSNMIVLEKKCIPIHAGDDQLCVAKYGQEKYGKDVYDAVQRKVNATPTFFFNGSVRVGYMEKDELKQTVCAAKYGVLWFLRPDRNELCK